MKRSSLTCCASDLTFVRERRSGRKQWFIPKHTTTSTEEIKLVPHPSACPFPKTGALVVSSISITAQIYLFTLWGYRELQFNKNCSGYFENSSCECSFRSKQLGPILKIRCLRALHVLPKASLNKSSNFAQDFIIFKDTLWTVSSICLTY